MRQQGKKNEVAERRASDRPPLGGEPRMSIAGIGINVNFLMKIA
jgi:hypothetical protein